MKITKKKKIIICIMTNIYQKIWKITIVDKLTEIIFKTIIKYKIINLKNKINIVILQNKNKINLIIISNNMIKKLI